MNKILCVFLSFLNTVIEQVIEIVVPDRQRIFYPMSVFTKIIGHVGHFRWLDPNYLMTDFPNLNWIYKTHRTNVWWTMKVFWLHCYVVNTMSVDVLQSTNQIWEKKMQGFFLPFFPANKPVDHFTNKFSIIIQIQWKIGFSITSL